LPNGEIVILGCFLKVKRVAQINGLLFCGMCYKNGLGYILGDSFANSSGHPAWKADLGCFTVNTVLNHLIV
jgi:hypothetical protein